MQREAGVWAGKPVGSELSTTFTPMSDKPPLGLRPRWLVLSDRADEIKAAIQRYETLGLLCPDDWLIELRDIERQQAILDPPQPEPVVATPTPAAPEPEPEPEQEPEIPEPLRTGAASFYVLVVTDNHPSVGGQSTVWEHPIPSETTLRAVLRRRDSIGYRYGTTYIATCRIIPELTSEVPAR